MGPGASWVASRAPSIIAALTLVSLGAGLAQGWVVTGLRQIPTCAG